VGRQLLVMLSGQELIRWRAESKDDKATIAELQMRVEFASA